MFCSSLNILTRILTLCLFYWVDGFILQLAGRDASCDLSFDDELLSRQHFAIEAGEDGFAISDLESANGTYVNGVLLATKRRLEDGDVIRAGQEKFVFMRQR
jgi:pSer/pThr/pTyr-binding forkhead associated (FHA) protein